METNSPVEQNVTPDVNNHPLNPITQIQDANQGSHIPHIEDLVENNNNWVEKNNSVEANGYSNTVISSIESIMEPQKALLEQHQNVNPIQVIKDVAPQSTNGRKKTSHKRKLEETKQAESPSKGFPEAKRRRKMWTPSEVNNLQEGVSKFGPGEWKKVFDAFEFSEGRTPVDLKDKWRNITQPRRPTAQQKRVYYLLDSENQRIGQYHNRFPRDAALKAATRGLTDIRLREPGSCLVHIFIGERHEVDAPQILKFHVSKKKKIFQGRVKKTSTVKIDNDQSIQQEKQTIGGEPKIVTVEPPLEELLQNFKQQNLPSMPYALPAPIPPNSAPPMHASALTSSNQHLPLLDPALLPSLINSTAVEIPMDFAEVSLRQ